MIQKTNNTATLRTLSKVFTPNNFKNVVRDNNHRFIYNQIEKYFINNDSLIYGDAITLIYKELHLKYKNEYLYKNALINKLLLGKYSLNTTTLLDEFKIGNSIADFVLLNGEAKIFEIKTELDGLDKLEKQLSDYCKFANKVYVVSNSKYVGKLLELYKESTIGVIEYTSRATLKEIKNATDNSHRFNHITIFKTLRKQEYLEIINDYYGFIPQVPNTLIFRECLSLAQSIDILHFQKLAYEKLKERKLRCPDLLKSSETPYELKHICYTLDFNSLEYQNLYHFLNQEI